MPRSCGIIVATLVAALLVPSAGWAATPTIADPWPKLQNELKDRYPAVQAVLVLHGECRAFEYFRPDITPDTRLPLHSMTKSVLSLLVGLAIHHGDFGIDQTLGDLLPEASGPTIDRRVRGISIRQMLTMTAGLDAEAKPPAGMPLSQMWRWSLTRPFLSAPGQQFRYDNFGANLLSVVLTRRIGQSAEAFAQNALFEPMAIRNVTWLDDGDGHSVGAYGLWLTAWDMAKIGLLALRRGRWNGEQIVPEEVVLAATRKHNEGGPPFYAAYGYFWWIKPTKTGENAFFAAGSDGQVIEVIPKQDLVIVLASDKTPTGGGIGFVNDVVLPVAAGASLSSCLAGKPANP